MVYLKTLLATFALFIGTQSIAYAALLPEYIKVCSRNDPQIAECFKNTAHNMRPFLKNGIPELNLPAMEPLNIGNMNIIDGGSNGLVVKTKNLNIFGASNFEIKKIKASENAKRFDFELLLPRLEGEGFYEMSGKMLSLPLNGNGPFTGNFTNFYAFVKVIFEDKKINDVDYITVKELEVKIRTGKGRIQLENMFNGDKILGDLINDTINQNFVEFTNELIVPIQRALSKKFKSVARRIVKNFTYNELFPV